MPFSPTLTTIHQLPGHFSAALKKMTFLIILSDAIPSPIPTRLLEEGDSNLIADMGDGMASDSIIRNVIFVRTGQNIAIQKLSYLKKN